MEMFRLEPSSGGGAMEHYISIDAMGQIPDGYEQGSECIDLIKAKKALAWDLGQREAIKEHPNNAVLYALEPELGDIVEIDPHNPRNYRFVATVVRGSMKPTRLRFSPDGKTICVSSKGDGVVWAVTDS
jgi:hypothetical protein